jgi:hypothetical protein
LQLSAIFSKTEALRIEVLAQEQLGIRLKTLLDFNDNVRVR